MEYQVLPETAKGYVLPNLVGPSCQFLQVQVQVGDQSLHFQFQQLEYNFILVQNTLANGIFLTSSWREISTK